MIDRRQFLAGTAGLALVAGTAHASPTTRVIPATGEAIPAIGLGSWLTFNVGNDPVLRAESTAVMEAFFAAGGGMIDSSPMYGSSQSVIGSGLETLGRPPGLFSADKVWTDAANGPGQIAETAAHWGIERFDLLQVHNLMDWPEHLALLQTMKAEGKLRYVGITTSHGRRHRDLAEIMRTQPLDFVQLTYNAADREAEDVLLPLAADRGIAVIVNRPFRRGGLTNALEGEALPGWAAEIEATSWAQILLKFVLAHPAVTVVIPATTQPAHMAENKAAATGPLPDAALTIRIAEHVAAL
jgi:diketogulonate reductase-like aldo/keto reductase